MNREIDQRIYERFQLIANGPALFNAVVSGLELGVFSFLAEHPGARFAELRQHTGLPDHQLRVLMLALCATELIDRREERYSNSSVAQQHLSSDGPESWHHVLIGWHRIYYPAFFHTTEALRKGTNIALTEYPGDEPTLYARLSHSPDLEAVLHRSMSAFTTQSMSGLAEHVNLEGVRHLLDVGGGDGTTARALATRFPDLEITIFDLPSVVARADAPTEGGRINARGGDFLHEDFPEGMDAILFSHVLEVFDEEQIVSLLTRACRALPSGGTTFIYGYNATNDETGGVIGARLSLYLNILATGKGMSYPAKDYEAWSRRAGFSEVTTIYDLPLEHGLTIAVK